MQAAHSKLVINRDVRPNNLMHTQSQIYLVDWGSATLQQNAPYEGTLHYASVGVLQQLTQIWTKWKWGLRMILSRLWLACSVLVIQMRTASCRKSKSCQCQSCSGGHRPGNPDHSGSWLWEQLELPIMTV